MRHPLVSLAVAFAVILAAAAALLTVANRQALTVASGPPTAPTRPGTEPVDGAPAAVADEAAGSKTKQVQGAATESLDPTQTAVAPSFDVVRVESSGEALIAGLAPPGSELEILAGDTVIARVTADAEGAFLATPEAALKPGDHDLSVRLSGETGTVAAGQRVAVTVPTIGRTTLPQGAADRDGSMTVAKQEPEPADAAVPAAPDADPAPPGARDVIASAESDIERPGAASSESGDTGSAGATGASGSDPSTAAAAAASEPGGSSPPGGDEPASVPLSPADTATADRTLPGETPNGAAVADGSTSETPGTGAASNLESAAVEPERADTPNGAATGDFRPNVVAEQAPGMETTGRDAAPDGEQAGSAVSGGSDGQAVEAESAAPDVAADATLGAAAPPILAEAGPGEPAAETSGSAPSDEAASVPAPAGETSLDRDVVAGQGPEVETIDPETAPLGEQGGSAGTAGSDGQGAGTTAVAGAVAGTESAEPDAAPNDAQDDSGAQTLAEAGPGAPAGAASGAVPGDGAGSAPALGDRDQSAPAVIAQADTAGAAGEADDAAAPAASTPSPDGTPGTAADGDAATVADGETNPDAAAAPTDTPAMAAEPVAPPATADAATEPAKPVDPTEAPPFDTANLQPQDGPVPPGADVASPVDDPAAPAQTPITLSGAEAAAAISAPAASIARAPNPALAIKAAEAEAKTLYVAGDAAPGTLVRIYADEELIGEAETNAEGSWLLEAAREVPLGNVEIRAAAVSADAAVPSEQAAAAFMRFADGIVLEPVAVASAAGGQGLASAVARPPTTYVIIRRGDNLWRISRRNYGRGIRYESIFAANRDQIRNPNRIYPGQVFIMPTRDRTWEAAIN